ncbi:Uncharacterised protein [Serratia proteamaculans]|nr:Uncharacterised protein [Serratia proteamaculans]
MRIQRQFIRRQLTAVVVQPLAAGGQLLRCFNLRIGRGQVALSGVQRDMNGRRPAAAEIRALPISTQIARRQVLALCCKLTAGGQCQFAAAAQLAILLYTGRQRTVFAAAQAGCLYAYMVTRSDRAAVLHLSVTVNPGIARRKHRTAVADTALRGQLRIAAAADFAAVFNPAVGSHYHTAGLRTDITGVTHPDAGFGTDHTDLTGIHAAQLRHVHRQLRTGSRIVTLLVDLLMRRIHLVATGGYFEIVSPKSGIDLRRSGDDLGVILARTVHTGTFNHHFAAFDVKTGQVTVVHLRLTGGQGGAVGIDKAAAVTGNTGRVGDHHLRPLTGHFDVTVQPAGIAGVDLIEDHLGFALRQPWVAIDPAALLGLGHFVGVVEDRALLVDVKLAVGIAGHPTGAWRLNIDLWRTVGAVNNGRLLATRRIAVGNNRRLHRLYGTQRDQQTKADGADLTDTLAQRLAQPRRTGRSGTAGAGDIRHHHQHATRFVENDTIQVLVHGNVLIEFLTARPLTGGFPTTAALAGG